MCLPLLFLSLDDALATVPAFDLAAYAPAKVTRLDNGKDIAIKKL